MRTAISLTIAAALIFVAGCSAAEPITEDGETQAAQSETTETEVAEVCDPAAAHPKGAFGFATQLDDSLPEVWRLEFGVIISNLQEVAPISPCLMTSGTQKPMSTPLSHP